jgi:hypothetical protein
VSQEVKHSESPNPRQPADFSRGNFSRIQNALIQEGHLANMERAEVATYMVVSMIASPGLTASFYIADIRALIGANHPETVRRALRSLAQAGLIALEIGTTGNGNLNLWRVTILQPPPSPSSSASMPRDRERTGSPGNLLDSSKVRMRTIELTQVPPRAITGARAHAEGGHAHARGAPAHLHNKEEEGTKGLRTEQEKGSVDEDMPANLKTDLAFLAIWDQWLRYRQEIRKPYKPTGRTAALEQLSDWGPKAAADSLRQSMACGWQGFFKPTEHGVIAVKHNGNGHRTTAAERGEYEEPGLPSIRRSL